VRLLTTDSALTVNAVAHGLAWELYLDELCNGGWVADIGLLGAVPFRADAVRGLEATRGILWEPDESPVQSQLLVGAHTDTAEIVRARQVGD
jgi:hypothetical protein